MNALRLDRIGLLLAVIVILYLLQSPPVVEYVHKFMYGWNIAVEYVVYFRDKEPYVFMTLPIALVYLLGRK